jgi:hypothetical protein
MSYDFLHSSVFASINAASQPNEMKILFELSLPVENGNFAPRLHIHIIWAPSAFRRDPLDISSRVFDIASFAMDTVLGVDNKSWI